MHSWRYYLNLSLYYLTMFLMVVAAARALKQPSFWIVTALLVLLHQAVRRAFSFTHPWHRVSLIEPDFHGFKDMTFQGSGGLRLYGRFAPSRNQGTIIMAHGLSRSGKDLELLARLLMRVGYGVLLLDLRAHGDSQGDVSTYGAREGEDITCAVQHLSSRIDVNAEKIGAYGFSLGAQAVLRGALHTDKIKALVLEGLGPARISDYGGFPRSWQFWIRLPFEWLLHLIYPLMSGCRQEGVREVLKELSPRPIFFIASGPTDIYFSRLFYAAAQEPKELWELPVAVHGGAIAQEPRDYPDRMIQFFNRSLNIQGGTR